MDSVSEVELWVVCPVCRKGNPAGTRFCQHCWGALLPQDTPITAEELKEVNRRREAYLKRKKRIKIAIIAFTPLAVLACVCLCLYNFTDTVFKPPQEVNSNPLPGEWTMFRHDLAHSGSAETSGLLPQGTLKWVFPTGAPIHSSPAVVDGSVYIGSQDYKLYALDAETGAKRWEYETGSWVESSPAIAKGVVYVGSNDGQLYALDAGSGEKIWDFQTQYPVRSSAAVANGVVYFGSDDYYLYAVDVAKGTKLWDYNTGSPAVSSPVVANGIVYTGGGSGYSYALNCLNGQRRLRYKTHYAVFSSPAVTGTTVYFVTNDGMLHAVDGMARTWWREHEINVWWIQLWAFGLPGVPKPPPQSGFLWSLWLGRGDTTSPVVAGDTMYLGWNNKLLAIDLQSHKVRWEFETGGAVRSSPAVAGPVVFVGSEDGKLYAVDAATGAKLWDFLTGDKITSSPAVVNGVVYVGSHDGNLYAIE
jgi:outer membrane protein assembly factor BamB